MIPEAQQTNTDEHQASAAGASPAEPPPAQAPTPPQGGTVVHRQRMPSGGRWVLSLGLTVLGGISWFLFGWGVAWGSPLVAVVSAAVPALTCLVAGWLLRSWWGLVAAVVVYVAVSALMWVLIGGGGPGGMAFLTIGFALYVVLAGVVMAAIGTAIGMYRAR